MASLMSILQQAGFKGEGLKMAYAIAMAESGGRANATNSVGNSAGTDRGLFQINSYYHSEVSDKQAFDALANAKAAYRISNGGKNWSQWSTYTNGAYKQYYGGSGGASVSNSSAGGGSTFSVGSVTPKVDAATLATEFGLTSALLKTNKELRDLVNQAVAEGWDSTLFTAHLKNSNWWRTIPDQKRQFILLMTGDPATYRQKYSASMYKLNQLAVQVGFGNQIMKNGKPTNALNRAIMYSMRDGWDDARIKAYFGGQVGMHGDQMFGEAGEAYDQLFQLTYNNGLTFAKTWFQSNIRSLLAGKTSLETLQGYIRNQAAAKYSSFADQIKAGQNAMDLAQPYISSVANILELPSTNIDLSNKWVNQAMTAKQKGTMSGTQYPLWQFENDLRSDPLWKQTNNARESMFSVAHKVAQDFGLSF